MRVKTYVGKSLQEVVELLNREYGDSYAILSVNPRLKWRFFLIPKREVEVVVGIEEREREERREHPPTLPVKREASGGAFRSFVGSVRKPPPVERGKPLIFFGPTGSGKTTLIGKTYVDLLNSGIEDIAVVSLDTFRLGAVEQLKIFCSVVDTPFQIAYDPDEFRDIVELLSEHRVVLVDTPGISTVSGNFEEVAAFLKATESVNVLTLDAGRDLEVLKLYIERFESLTSGVALTKLDEASGRKLELLRELIGDKPVYAISYRQNLTEGFERLWR